MATKPIIETGSIEQFQELARRQRIERGKRLAERESRLTPHVKLDIKVSNPMTATTWHNPATPRERAAVRRRLRNEGWFDPDPEADKINAELDAKEAQQLQAKQVQVQNEKQEKLQRQNQPENRIIDFWHQGKHDKIKAMSLCDLKTGTDIIETLYKKSGLAMLPEEFYSLNAFLHSTIVAKQTETPEKKHFL